MIEEQLKNNYKSNRIDDLNPKYLRNDVSKKLIKVAEQLDYLGKDFDKILKL